MEFITDYKSYNSKEVLSTCKLLCQKYDFLKMYTAGNTVLNSKIPFLKLGTSKECMLFTASTHGNEYITTTIILRFLEELCQSYAAGKPLCGIDMPKGLGSRSVIVVPMVNPDGCNIAINGVKGLNPKTAEFVNRLCGGNYGIWKANSRGVDINHNFSAGWGETRKKEKSSGILGPAAGKFGGEYPSSEPETVALTILCRLLKPRHIVALHTQGEEIYYGYKKPNAKETKMAEIFAMTSGYNLEEPDSLSADSGFKDWFVKEFARPGFTFECGRGKNPLPMGDSKKIYEKIKETLAIAAII